MLIISSKTPHLSYNISAEEFKKCFDSQSPTNSISSLQTKFEGHESPTTLISTDPVLASKTFIQITAQDLPAILNINDKFFESVNSADPAYMAPPQIRKTTLLHWAIRNGCHELTKLLLSKKEINVNEREYLVDNRYRRILSPLGTPLDTAVEKGDTEDDNKTALDVAALAEKVELIKLLFYIKGDDVRFTVPLPPKTQELLDKLSPIKGVAAMCCEGNYGHLFPNDVKQLIMSNVLGEN